MTVDTSFTTVNIDMAASLVAQGLPCFITTYDGFQVEFEFRDEHGLLARDLSQRWSGPDDLAGPSRRLSVTSRRIRIEMRKIREEYGKVRVPVQHEFKP